MRKLLILFALLPVFSKAQQAIPIDSSRYATRSIVITQHQLDSLSALMVRLGSTYSNPTWLTSLSWTKLTGTPSGSGYSKFSGNTITYNATIPNSDLANSLITINGTPVSLGGSITVGGSTNFVSGETPTGSINGINSTFTIARTPISGSLSVYINGIMARPTTDYTISGTTITMIDIPKTGDNLMVNYQY